MQCKLAKRRVSCESCQLSAGSMKAKTCASASLNAKCGESGWQLAQRHQRKPVPAAAHGENISLAKGGESSGMAAAESWR